MSLYFVIHVVAFSSQNKSYNFPGALSVSCKQSEKLTCRIE